MDSILELLPIEVANKFNKDLPVIDLQNIIFEYLDCEVYEGQIIHNLKGSYEETNKKTLEYIKTMEKSKCHCCKKENRKLFFTTDVDDCIIGSNSGGMKTNLLCVKCSVEHIMDWLCDIYPRKTKLTKTLRTLEKGKYTEVSPIGIWCIRWDKNNVKDLFQ